MSVLHIAWWDVRRVAKDWRAFLWLLAMPLVFISIFGAAFRDRGPRSTWIPVVDLDRSGLSEIFVNLLRGEGYFIDVKGAANQRELKDRWPYGIVVPEGFQERVLRGERIDLTVVKGWGSAEQMLDVQSRLALGVLRFTKGLILADTSHRDWDDAGRDALRKAIARPDLLTVNRRGDTSLMPPAAGFNQSLPGMLVMFVLQMVLTYGGATLVSDRVHGQFARLLAAPMHPLEVYVGKALGRVLLALLQASLLLLCGSLFFGIPLGSHPGFLIPVVTCFALFAGFMSIVGGLLCKTEKQVIQLAICTSDRKSTRVNSSH